MVDREFRRLRDPEMERKMLDLDRSLYEAEHAHPERCDVTTFGPRRCLLGAGHAASGIPHEFEPPPSGRSIR